jgi:hypothetical protein
LLQKKNKGKPNIAPLQLPTLATFRSWGDSAGAGRAGLLMQRYNRKMIFSSDEDKNVNCQLGVVSEGVPLICS